MSIKNRYLLALVALTLLEFCNGCSNPEITAQTFTTQDSTIVTNIAYISEFSVKCATGAADHLYADVEGAIVPVSELAKNKYQISWTEEIKTARRGDIPVKLFDEDGYTAIRKALRSSEDTSAIAPLATIVVNHLGAFNGPWLKSEFLAAALSFVVAYLALSSRAKLLA